MDLMTFIGIICAFVVLWNVLGWWADWSASRPHQIKKILREIDEDIKRAR